MRQESKWTNPEFVNTQFIGKYERNKDNIREFVLISKQNGVVLGSVTYKSHEDAKAAKWQKVK